MSIISDSTLRRFVKDNSVIVTRGHGPCPVFARDDRRSPATDWLSRDTVAALEAEGILAPVGRGLGVSKAARNRLKS